MGSGARRIHTEFEREVVERLERIEKRLEHAGLHMPCLLDKPPEGWTDNLFNPVHNVASSSRYLSPPSDELVRGVGGKPPVRLVPDENESYGYIDDRGEVGMQDFDGGDSAPPTDRLRSLTGTTRAMSRGLRVYFR